MDMNEIMSFEKLYESMWKCKKGVGWKDSVMAFCLRGIERTLQLEDELKSNTYQPKAPVAFRITNPKPRDIISISFRDRVYQRSLNDNAIYPIMTHSFIYDNWACQKGKGTLKCKERLKEFLRRYYRHFGAEGYVLQCDIHGYYPNMLHDKAESAFREKLPHDIAEAAVRILRDQYSGDIGYNPGSQMIQIAGISLLDKLDHFIKEQLHVRYYLRYMDDFILIHSDKEYLEHCKAVIRNEIGKLGFTFNEKKTRVFPLSDGVMFLGFRFFLSGTGKVTALIDPRKVKAERKKLRRLVAKCKRGDLPCECVEASYQCWRQHASYGDSHKLLKRMDEYYTSLWRDGNEFRNQDQNQRGTADRGNEPSHRGTEKDHC